MSINPESFKLEVYLPYDLISELDGIANRNVSKDKVVVGTSYLSVAASKIVVDHLERLRQRRVRKRDERKMRRDFPSMQ